MSNLRESRELSFAKEQVALSCRAFNEAQEYLILLDFAFVPHTSQRYKEAIDDFERKHHLYLKAVYHLYCVQRAITRGAYEAKL